MFKYFILAKEIPNFKLIKFSHLEAFPEFDIF